MSGKGIFNTMKSQNHEITKREEVQRFVQTIKPHNTLIRKKGIN